MQANGSYALVRYDGAGRVVSTATLLNAVSAYGPDGLAQTSVTYGAGNRVLTTTDAMGNVTTQTYDVLGNLMSTTDARGTKTTNVYDVLNRLTESRTVDAALVALSLTDMAYDANGNKTSVTRYRGAVGTGTNGETTTEAYDLLGRRVSETGADPDGAGALVSPVTLYSYDAAGNLLSVTDALGHVTTYGYDALNRQVTVTGADPDGGGPLASPVTTTTYDGDGNVLTVTDALGHVTTFGYDKLNRQVTVTGADPDGSGPLTSPVTATTYDTAGNGVDVVDALGHGTGYRYDALNRKVRETLTGAGAGGAGSAEAATTWVFNAAGNLAAVTDALGHSTLYAYDALNRKVGELDASPDGVTAGPLTTMTYDANGGCADGDRCAVEHDDVWV